MIACQASPASHNIAAPSFVRYGATYWAMLAVVTLHRVFSQHWRSGAFIIEGQFCHIFLGTAGYSLRIARVPCNEHLYLAPCNSYLCAP